jgi:putative transposase
VSRYIDEHRARFGVEPICRTLGVSASAYYRRATGQRSERQVEDERLLGVIRTTHKKNFGAYGYRRTWKALLRAGERVARCRVQRLMREAGIQGAKRRGKPWRTTKADPDASRPRDLVCRNFTASAPNRLWVCDFTRIRERGRRGPRCAWVNPSGTRTDASAVARRIRRLPESTVKLSVRRFANAGD